MDNVMDTRLQTMGKTTGGAPTKDYTALPGRPARQNAQWIYRPTFPLTQP